MTSELSPSERALASGTLALFPDGEPDERAPIAVSDVAIRPELRMLGGVRKLSVDETPIVQLLVAAGSSPERYQRRLHDAWFKREAAKTYLARPIYEYDRVPQELHRRRVNAGITTFEEY